MWLTIMQGWLRSSAVQSSSRATRRPVSDEALNRRGWSAGYQAIARDKLCLSAWHKPPEAKTVLIRQLD